MGGTGGSCMSRRDAALKGANGPGGAWLFERNEASLCALVGREER